jgi:hypothetical protein
MFRECVWLERICDYNGKGLREGEEARRELRIEGKVQELTRETED